MRPFEVNNDRLGVLYGLTQDPAPLRTSAPPTSPLKSKSRSRASPPPEKEGRAPESKANDLPRPRKSKFKFKRKHQNDSHHHRSPSSHSHSHSSSRRKRSHHKPPDDDPAEYDDTYIPNLASANFATAEDAFRESLFDAMADDEGAAFWEGVYGQPINVYPRPDGRGELEKMTDEEYAEYVRSKMWEKTHEHIIEERNRREEARRAKKQRDEEEQKMWEEGERSRRREEKTRRRLKEKTRVEKQQKGYLEKWREILAGKMDGDIPWPVESGKLKDIEKVSLERFYMDIRGCLGEDGLLDILKVDRIRWHPDKAQQRWGKRGLSEEEQRGITAVFQTVDSLWVKYKGRK
ncbi:unnamed protein product [Tuber melanosporum]|uniref:(Perigord truffle) hypothetical protein n=1 Tax=Tuber melanosporum (strain Mel28) TaxID=656061 RepID=D5GJJ0_TUBMM|nr:uncharacterized protein GSTUM_00009037001 [Tuber melanosporum]CAZ84683.1 unnamed protein product [Tuber melanosporum]